MATDDPSLLSPLPLSPPVEMVLAWERIIPELSETVRERLITRAQASLQTGAAIAREPRRTPQGRRRLLFAAAAGVVLMASVAAAFQMMKRSLPAPSANQRLQRQGLRKPIVPRAAETGLDPAATPASHAPGAGASAHLPSTSDSALEELRLLERARKADARGDYASVLALADQHERSYPNGRLTEEREVLRVKALVALGRGKEARQVAAQLRQRFPHSVLLPRIQEMLASLR